MIFRLAGVISFVLISLSCTTKLKSALWAADDLKPRSSPVQVGEMGPDFTLDDQNNRKVTLSSARGSAPTVLVIYRGNW